MDTAVNIILEAGESAVRLALFTLLPILVVMMTLMEFLKIVSVLPAIESFLEKPLRLFGLPPRGAVAMVELLLVSFAAPYLSMKELNDDETTADAHLASTLAVVLTMAQANVTFPLLADGLSLLIIPFSLIGGLAASSLTFKLFAPSLGWFEGWVTKTALYLRIGAWFRRWSTTWSTEKVEADEVFAKREPPVAARTNPIQRLIGKGEEGVFAALKAVPFLILGYGLMNTLKHFGIDSLVQAALSPLLELLGLPDAAALPIITKYVAGGTAMMGVAHELIGSQPQVLSAQDLNRMAGLTINPCDLVGVFVLLAAAPRAWSFLRVLGPALLGTAFGVAIRMGLHLWVF